MTFNPTYMSPYEVGVGQSSMRWHYDTLDTRAVVEAPGYFNAFADKLSIGDIIEVLVSDSVVAGTRTVVVDSFTLMVRGTTGGVTTGESALEAQFAKWIGTTYGVPNNGTDAAATLRAAAAAVAQNEIMRLRPGTYLVSSPVTQTVKNPTWETDFGALIDSASSLKLFVDRAKPFKTGGPQTSAKSIIGGTTATGVESLVFSSWRVGVTGATSSYEKIAWWIGAISSDPSSGTGNGGVGTAVNLDTVTSRYDATIEVGNLSGRVWAQLLSVNIPVGADGHGTGLEIDIDNNGSAVSDQSSSFGKVGIKIGTKTGSGTVAFTFGSGSHASGDGFYSGLKCDQDGLVDDPVSSFLKMTSFWRVARTGYTYIGKDTAGVNTAGIELDPAGQVSVSATGTQAVLLGVRTGIPSATQGLLNVSAQGKNASGTNLIFAQLKFNAKTVTAAAEDGEFSFNAYVAGTTASQASISAGMQIGVPTGGYKGIGSLNLATALYVNGNQVVGARNTGWLAMTGASDKATAYDPSTITLAQLAGRVSAMQIALTSHGLIGV